MSDFEIYYDRKLKGIMKIPLFQSSLLEALFQKKWGIFLREYFLKYPYFSFLYGKYLDTTFSRKMIKDFIRDYKIEMSRFERKNYRSFNDFFIRKLRNPEKEIDFNPAHFISPADSRLLVYPDLDERLSFEVKGKQFTLEKLIPQRDDLGEKYKGGTLLIFRLTPLDYHRFHFVDDGIPTESCPINGFYYTVNPISFQFGINPFIENKREYSFLKTNRWGDILYCEVGAIGVAGIKQLYQPGQLVKRGDEKGYFYFGASTVILLLEKGKLKIDEDILKASQKQIETRVYVGEKIGGKV